MKRWIATMFLFAIGCADDDDGEGSSGETGSDETSVADGGPCGIAGGPLTVDELHTPQIGTSAAGRPVIVVELHEAGTCNGEPPVAVASLELATDGTISVSAVAVEITTPADYHDERYWWDALGVDAQLVHTETDVTVTFNDGTNMPTITCVPDMDAVSCS